MSSMKLYPVKGKVLLADGKPLTAGNIVFIETKSQVRSQTAIDSSGGFALKGPRGDDALPVGEYRVSIEPAMGAPDKKGRATVELPFASKYTDEDGSDLKAVVTTDASTNNFEFKLDPKGKEEASSQPGKLGVKRRKRD